MDLSAPQCAFLLDLARHTIRRSLGDCRLPVTAVAVSNLKSGMSNPLVPESRTPNSLSDPALLQPAGCFVTLHELHTHRLRGCIGRLDASQPLLHTVENMARAVLEDPRFTHYRVGLNDLPNLELEITVLSPLCPAEHVLAFDLLTEGIYLTIDCWSGCFLPQVARETGWTREQLLARLCTEKLGMSPDAWRSPAAKLQTFTAFILGPEPFEPQ